MKKMKRKGPQRSEIEQIVDELRHYLPSQAPIKDFVHHNTIHAFQDLGLNFDESIRQASLLYGSREYLPLKDYRAAYAKGKISEAALDFVLASEKSDRFSLKEAMLHGELPEVAKRSGFRASGYLHAITQLSGVILEEHVHPLVYRLVANYLDQGIAAISMSEHDMDFWKSLCLQVQTARPSGISAAAANRICAHSPERSVEILLAEILPDGADNRVFLLEVLMAARGWSGIVAQIEDNPKALIYPRQIKLMQYLALYLILLKEKLEQFGYDRTAVGKESPNAIFFQEACPPESEVEKISRLWQEAFEMTFYFETLKVLETNGSAKRDRFSRVGKVAYQAFFCIDDRESSLRRHLEEISDSIETFATPGFFAIDAVYLGPFDTFPIKQCPVPVNPQHQIRGVLNGRRKLPVSRFEMNFWHRHANNLFYGWIISQVFGLVSLVRLWFSVHFPSHTFVTASSFAGHEHDTELKYERPAGEGKQNGYFEGYTVEEMAERVHRVLNQVGLTTNFADLIAIVGHGSSSTNNPYFAAYDCGACSGRSGLVNARTFARMANRPDVRALVGKLGIKIPDTTWFVGAIHDTARDEIVFTDDDLVPEKHKVQLADLDDLFKKALQVNAHERVRRFMDVGFPRSSRGAIREAKLRTQMLFEPRPEYNHATNALAIVGRRSLSEDIFLDRRAFYNSYDPTADKDGKILNGILTPLTPVCGGINLEYLFSRIDNVVYGAGSKLPQNVFSLIGVGNGVDGDLRTGLPEQMIEIHDPMRLLIVVEQKRSIVLKVLKGNQAVFDWVNKGWVKFCIYDYSEKKFYFYNAGAFVKLALPDISVADFADSSSAYRGSREAIAPSLIRRGR
jgi:uncharacterized protein